MTPTAFALSLENKKPNEKQVASMIHAKPSMGRDKLIKLKEYIKGSNHIPMEYDEAIDSILATPQKAKETSNLRPTTKWESASTESDFDLLVATKLHQLKDSAMNRNKEFNLTFSDVKKLVKRKTCYYTGLKFDVSLNDYQLTIDRIDSAKGYVKGNVVTCLNIVNSTKEHLLECERSFFKNNPKLLVKMLSKLI